MFISYFSPEGKKFRSKTDLAGYFEKNAIQLDIDDFVFSVRGKRDSAVLVVKADSSVKRKPGRPSESAKTTETSVKIKPASLARKLVVKMKFSNDADDTKQNEGSTQASRVSKSKKKPVILNKRITRKRSSSGFDDDAAAIRKGRSMSESEEKLSVCVVKRKRTKSDASTLMPQRQNSRKSRVPPSAGRKKKGLKVTLLEDASQKSAGKASPTTKEELPAETQTEALPLETSEKTESAGDNRRRSRTAVRDSAGKVSKSAAKKGSSPSKPACRTKANKAHRGKMRNDSATNVVGDSSEMLAAKADSGEALGADVESCLGRVIAEDGSKPPAAVEASRSEAEESEEAVAASAAECAVRCEDTEAVAVPTSRPRSSRVRRTSEKLLEAMESLQHSKQKVGRARRRAKAVEAVGRPAAVAVDIPEDGGVAAAAAGAQSGGSSPEAELALLGETLAVPESADLLAAVSLPCGFDGDHLVPTALLRDASELEASLKPPLIELQPAGCLRPAAVAAVTVVGTAHGSVYLDHNYFNPALPHVLRAAVTVEKTLGGGRVAGHGAVPAGAGRRVRPAMAVAVNTVNTGSLVIPL